MSTKIASFGKSGTKDFLLQRLTAIILGLYFISVFCFLLTNPELTFVEWKAYMGSTYMKVFTFVALISLGSHGWIGLWGVSTDYLTERHMGSKATPLRLIFQLAVVLVSIVYVVWGAMILWGVQNV